MSTDTTDTRAPITVDQHTAPVKSSDAKETSLQNVEQSKTSSTSSAPDAATSLTPLLSSDAARTVQVDAAAAESAGTGDDITGAPVESVAGPSTDQVSLGGPVAASTGDQESVVGPSADQESVASSASKTDSLVVVAATPERISPSDDSSNAKGLLASDCFNWN